MTQLRADVFPVVFTATHPDGTTSSFDKARVVLTLDHVYVFQDAQPQPALVFDDRLTSYTPPIKATRVKRAQDLVNRQATFETEDGYTGSFYRMSGCGCGSRLKNARVESLLPDTNSITGAASTKDEA